MRRNLSEHLSKAEKTKLGSYYTPKKLVGQVYKFVAPYLKRKKVIIFDSTAGCGAFLIKSKIKNLDFRGADCDTEACKALEKTLDKTKIFCTNSLTNVNREKYLIQKKAFLIVVGNPPYNDTTSEFRKNEKGENICDEDLKDRDMGISFLKSYDKLKADVVCVLHPLSYLIKETNFNRLDSFRLNYKLVRGLIFSSSVFFGTSTKSAFPVLIGLYERNKKGMSYEDIKTFSFEILGSKRKFVLAKFVTVDSYINKYPPRKNDEKISELGLYYNTFRDINSLKRNAAFVDKEYYNGIVVTLENFYKYAYLYAFKQLFGPRNIWLYGNLSPLVDKKYLEKHKKKYIIYAIKNNKIIEKIDKKIYEKLLEFYQLSQKEVDNSKDIEGKIKRKLDKLVK